MKHRRQIVQIAYSLLLTGVMSILFCCAPQDPAVIASKVAQEWASNNVDGVSRSIAGLVDNSNPLIERAVSMTIAKQINQRIAWEYSPPEKLAEERYEVVATAYSEVELPLLGNYRVSVNYTLEIDTKLKQVIDANMEVSSFAIKKL
jgi:hypothetical protein